jgi:hypothetical protein
VPPRTPKLAAAWCVAAAVSRHSWSKSIDATAAFAICESVAGVSASSSEMLTPPAMLRSGVNANFSSGVIVVRVSYGRGISGLSGSAFSVGLRQS